MIRKFTTLVLMLTALALVGSDALASDGPGLGGGYGKRGVVSDGPGSGGGYGKGQEPSDGPGAGGGYGKRGVYTLLAD